MYKANVKQIVMEPGPDGRERAVGVSLADGRRFRSKTVISNASRWDTFEGFIGDDRLPEGEKLFRKRYKKAPSFFSMHLGIKSEVGLTQCRSFGHAVWDCQGQLDGLAGKLQIRTGPGILHPSPLPL